MKTVILVRHAKSSWKEVGLADWQRPLNKRGKRDAPVMGKRLADLKIDVEKILSSTAIRARHTAELLAQHIGFQGEIDLRGELYDADVSLLIDVLKSVDNAVESVMLVAHNPGMTDLVNHLGRRSIENVPTCGMAIIKYEMKGWGDIEQVVPIEFYFDFPKNKAGD